MSIKASEPIMVFGGRLDILVISADLSEFLLLDESELKEDLNTFVEISIDGREVGTTPVRPASDM